MKIRSLFWATLGFFLLLTLFSMRENVFASYNLSLKKQIEQVDRQIEDLSDMKRGYEAKVLRNQNQAQRLQFIQKEYATAKKHYRIAEQNRKKVKKLEKRIAKLEQKKHTLLEKNQEEKKVSS